MLLMTESDLPLRRIARGKVRDVYEVEGDRLLLVATDRVSAYDVVMAEPIPMKGAVLTQVSAWWFRQLGGLVKHHMISADADEIIAAVPALDGPSPGDRRTRHAVQARHRVPDRMRDPRLSLGLGVARICREQDAGRRDDAGRPERERRLDPPIFSPATKAESGHDENITVGRMREILGAEVTARARAADRAVYGKGRDVARGARHHHRRHQVRVRAHEGRRDHPDRRGDDARQLALLAGRRLPAGQAAAQLRQAAVARLARCRAPCRPLERRCAAAEAAARGRGGDEQALPRGLSPPDGRALVSLTRASSALMTKRSDARSKS